MKDVKIQKSQIITVSRLKQAQWKELEQELSKFAETYFGKEHKKRSKNSDNGDFAKYIEDTVKGILNFIFLCVKLCKQ